MSQQVHVPSKAKLSDPTYLLVTDLNPTIIISIKLSEWIRQRLDCDRSLHKVIKGNISTAWTRSYKQWVRKSGERKAGRTPTIATRDTSTKTKKKAFALSYKAKERTIFIVFLNQQVDKVVREVVTEGTKGIFHLGTVNASWTVDIKCLKALLPVFYVLPETSEFIEIDCTGVVWRKKATPWATNT